MAPTISRVRLISTVSSFVVTGIENSENRNLSYYWDI